MIWCRICPHFHKVYFEMSEMCSIHFLLISIFDCAIQKFIPLIHLFVRLFVNLFINLLLNIFRIFIFFIFSLELQILSFFIINSSLSIIFYIYLLIPFT